MKRSVLLVVAIVTMALLVPGIWLTSASTPDRIAAGSVEAAQYPEKGKSITILVPWAAGGWARCALAAPTPVA